jgi:hypothetical protein
MNLKALLLITSIILSFTLFSQIDNVSARNAYFQPHKNTIYVETFGATGLGLSVNYKRIFPLSDNKALNASGGFGYIFFSLSDQSDFTIPLSFTFTTGKTSAFEVGAGFSFLVKETIYIPNIPIGFRRQKNNFFFWVGLVNLFFIDPNNNMEIELTYLPAPGIRFGRAF